MISMKTCNRCKHEKALSEYHKNKNNKDGLNNRCVSCTLEYNRERYRKKSPKLLAWQKNYYVKNSRKILLKKYGLTEEDYSEILLKQNGLCAICKKKPEYNLYVDHDHATGDVRGLLCLQCNTALGNFYDDIGLLNKAIDYLRPVSSDG